MDPNQQNEQDSKTVFWSDKYQGERAEGGYFIRNSLKEFITKLEETGKKVIGIAYDGSYNLEILVEAE